MSNTNSSLSPRLWFYAGVMAACLTSAMRAEAQTPANDNRWRPWLGCWSATAPRFVDLDAQPQQVCVVPAAGTSAVDVVTVTGDKIVSRERIDPNGEHRPGERDGCAGWESAEWSSDMRRVYLQSEYQCPGGIKRGTTGLMATAANGDWLDIVGVGLRDKVGVRILRHRAAPPLSTLPPEIASAVARDSREPVALKVLLPIGDAEIIDASKHVSGAVIEAVEHGARLQRHVADAIVLAHERFDRIEAVEPHDGLELDLLTEVALHQIDVAKARDIPRFDAGDHLAANDPFISVGIVGRGPPAPHAADHHTRIGMST